MQHKLNKLALALIGIHCGAAMAGQFSDAYFFGDSLTDSGAFAGQNYNAITGGNPAIFPRSIPNTPVPMAKSGLNLSPVHSQVKHLLPTTH